MKMKVMSVYDSKALVFNNPFFAVTTPAGVRSFADLANDPQTMVAKHPGDYVLYELGEYDDSTGQFVNYDAAKHLGVATAYREDNNKLEVK